MALTVVVEIAGRGRHEKGVFGAVMVMNFDDTLNALGRKLKEQAVQIITLAHERDACAINRHEKRVRMKIRIKTAHGTYLRAGDDGIVNQADRPDAWETFDAEILDDPPWAAKDHTHAQPEPTPGPTPESTPTPTPARRTGLVRANGRCVADDGGDFLAFGTSLFWAAWGYRHDRNRLKRNLAFLEGKVDYIRCLGVVGPRGWSDRTIDPRWPDYEDVIAGVTDLAYEEYGIRTQWTIFGGVDLAPGVDAQRRVVEQFIHMASTREKRIFLWEMANEGWQTGFGSGAGVTWLRAYATRFQSETPNLVAVTAPPGEADAPLWYRGSATTAYTTHLDRSVNGTGAEWRPTRQAWEVQFVPYVPRLWINNEPRGPQSSVTQTDDPLLLTMDAALTWLCGGAAYTLHTGAGIRGGGAEDLARGRSTNIWEVPNINAILDGINRMREILPSDLPNWQRHNANAKFPDYPFDTDLLVPRIVDETVLRAYAATDGNRFIVIPIRVRGSVPFRARRDMTFSVISPMTGLVLGTYSLAAGQTFTLPLDREAVVMSGKVTR